MTVNAQGNMIEMMVPLRDDDDTVSVKIRKINNNTQNVFST